MFQCEHAERELLILKAQSHYGTGHHGVIDGIKMRPQHRLINITDSQLPFGFNTKEMGCDGFALSVPFAPNSVDFYTHNLTYAVSACT